MKTLPIYTEDFTCMHGEKILSSSVAKISHGREQIKREEFSVTKYEIHFCKRPSNLFKLSKKN